MRSISNFTKLIFFALFMSLCVITAKGHGDHSDHAKCGHNDTTTVENMIKVEEDDSWTLNSHSTNFYDYPKMRFHADYSLIEEGELKDYIQYQLMPAVIDFFETTISIKRPLIAPLKVPRNQRFTCGVHTPKSLWDGVSADFSILVSTTDNEDVKYAAQSSLCHRVESGRPAINLLSFCTRILNVPNGDALVHEKNIYLAMHEMIHSLGFSKISYQYFVDSHGHRLENHLRNVTLYGEERTILDVKPLTKRLRKHLGCHSLPGALLEQDGNNGSKNSHFERRLFLYEVMTSGVLHGRRISEFSLAVLEGSGWYGVNYDASEPFFFGQGQGCTFWNGPKPTEESVEFCVEEKVRGCSPTGRGGGICSKDPKSDNLHYQHPKLDYDCENPEAVLNARLFNSEKYGKDSGSRCFAGTLARHQSFVGKTNFCFKFECHGKDLDTVLKVKIGKVTARCHREGPISVDGFLGELFCPDPIEYCNTVGLKYCPRNCMGRGYCSEDKKCMCLPGYSGEDCSISIFGSLSHRKHPATAGY